MVQYDLTGDMNMQKYVAYNLCANPYLEVPPPKKPTQPNFFTNFSSYVEEQQSSQARQGAYIEYGAGDIRIENVSQKILR